MKVNMGTVDRILRIVIAIVLIGLAIYLTGWVRIVLAALALVMLVTALAARCPLYLPFGISTAGKSSEKTGPDA